MKKRALIFFDIDGTLLKSNYTVNSKLVPQYIEKLSKKGYLFCLNSNRSERDLKPIIRAFGINGPIVGEGGMFCLFQRRRFLLIKMPTIRKQIVSMLNNLAVENNAIVKLSDTVNYSLATLKSVPLVWIINKYRKWTASIHVVAYGKRNYRAAIQLGRLLQKQWNREYNVQVSPIFSNVLISPRLINKGKALAILREKYFSRMKLFMIGDDSADLSTQRVVDAFFAVGNAEQQLKNKALYVAQKPYTQGVVEILRYIDKCIP
jgi:HAD superfamily hydrolase (TIGR01484 family)